MDTSNLMEQIGDLGLNEMVLIEGNERAEKTEDKTAPNCYDHI